MWFYDVYLTEITEKASRYSMQNPEAVCNLKSHQCIFSLVA